MTFHMQCASLCAALVCFSVAAAHTVDDQMKSDHEHHDHHSHPLLKPDRVDPGHPIIAHECVHDKVAMKDIPVTPQTYAVDPPWKQSRAMRPEQTVTYTATVYNNIRFKFFFDVDNLGHCSSVGQTVNHYQGGNVVCNTSDILTPLKKDYILNVVMPGAVSFIQAALNVIPISGSLASPASCNGITTGSPQVAEADFVAFLTAVPMSDPNSATVAWATTCSSDQNGRPVVGQINFVPSRLDNANTRIEYRTDQDINTAIHETAHALGFSSQFFGQYVDENNVRQNNGRETTTDATLGKSVTKLVTPRVLRAARAYFGCSSLTGVEIEDQGGAGTIGSHWEKRILYTEFITGILSSVKTYISNITLAYFEDTGHYTANYGAAQTDEMSFGKGRGCDFVTRKCDAVGGPEFCFDDDNSHMYCSVDYLARGYCGAVAFGAALPSHMQYFNGQPNVGGAVDLADYCPTGLGYSNFVCVDGSSKDSQNVFGNTYGGGSRCFQSNIMKKGYSAGSVNHEARCFPVLCTPAGRVQLDIQGETAHCPTDGSAGNADVSGLSSFTGSIYCPKATTFCKDPSVPTPAPTPAPPTPIPTPAPPGFTPGPAPFRRPATPAPTFAATCADRPSVADLITVRLPWCRAFAAEVVRAFGTDCDGELAKWLAVNDAVCTDSFAWGNQNCVEGPSGGAAMCALLNRS